MSEFKVTQAIGDIVAALPGAIEVFKKYGIDFCCGGHRPLSEALKSQGLDAGAVLRDLDEANDNARAIADRADFREMSAGELIDHIENTHHLFVKRTLPEISLLASAILRAHGPGHPYLFKVHKLYHNLMAELDRHLVKEEEILFPLIREYAAGGSEEVLQKAREVMGETEDEHEEAGAVLKELRRITDDYAVPEDGCETFRMAYDALKALEDDLFRHIHLENNILFKKLA